LPKLVEDCEQLLPNSFIFHVNGAPAYASRELKSNYSDFITKHSAP